ncbi:DUF3611 family protein [Kamptonema formosum]|uniref:DUF3611 family protein n=1 Tax=Kamptonema formosum TaxID=331992 RepID=UPI00034B700D|nr:DUF3611 family protein [Oscillatoria sp. PCC 10802]
MSNQSEPPALPPSVQRVVPIFRYAGWASFWVQVVLAVIASLIFAFAGFSSSAPRTAAGAAANNPGSGPGLFFTVCGLLVLGVSIYWSFRYTRLAQQLQSSNPNLRPKKADAMQLLRRGLILNLAGMGLTLMGAEAITGTLLGKALAQPQALLGLGGDLSKLIQPLDIFVVLGNTHTLVAHFAGILTALWLINSVSRQ